MYIHVIVCGPRAEGVHIRQITHAHGITITCILYLDMLYIHTH